jgi:hypothetical protein
MNNLLKMAAVIVISVTSSYAFSCDCMYFSNAQQAAQGANTVVAKVSTAKLDPSTGLGTLVIEKIYKGSISEKTINVAGDDGGNCAGSILPASTKSWVGIFKTDEDGSRYMAACANSSLNFDAAGNIIVPLSKELITTEQEFTDLVNLKLVPTVTSLSCVISASRMFVPENKTDVSVMKDFDVYEYVTGEAADPLSVKYVKDLKSDGFPSPLVVHANASLGYKTASNYYVTTELSEPFFGITTSQHFNVDVTETGYVQDISMSAYKDAKGVTLPSDGTQSFYAYTASVQCNLDLGAPLIPAVEK